MSQEEKPPREFWIPAEILNPLYASNTSGEPPLVHVIEYSAYSQMRERAEAAEKDCAKWKDEYFNLTKFANDYERRAELAESRIAKLRSALEKIGDPTKRDHREPDKYTECGCMMNMADEALAEDDKASK